MNAKFPSTSALGRSTKDFLGQSVKIKFRSYAVSTATAAQLTQFSSDKPLLKESSDLNDKKHLAEEEAT